MGSEGGGYVYMQEGLHKEVPLLNLAFYDFTKFPFIVLRSNTTAFVVFLFVFFHRDQRPVAPKW